ncbi:Hpt domain-containing protein [Falsigemmobacter intermedius]|uniref:Hpt domain-containing protein n=1 Tax=Falsigemmobacter intermedius TaxID=1553448 RepID=UPI003EFDA7C0
MLNLQQLDDLRSDVGEDGFADLIALFLEETDGVVARMTAPGPKMDPAADFHFLKGAARNLGLESFSAVCHEAELAAAAGQPAPLSPADLDAAWRESRIRLLAQLGMADPVRSEFRPETHHE